MANILLLANLNCDHVLSLNSPLQSGARIHYRDQGRRLGGGGANTGIGLLWAGHHVSIASRVGSDATGQWLLEQAQAFGLDTRYVECFTGTTSELLILVDDRGERTILRQQRRSDLPHNLPTGDMDLLYVNWQGNELVDYMTQIGLSTRVVAQYPGHPSHKRPAHILIASCHDMRSCEDPWQHALKLCGSQLEWLVITNGENGATAIQGEKQLQISAHPVSVVDTTGAGDAFAGGLIHGLACGKAIEEALQIGCDWAAFAVSSASSTPSAELKAWLHSTGNC